MALVSSEVTIMFFLLTGSRKRKMCASPTTVSNSAPKMEPTPALLSKSVATAEPDALSKSNEWKEMLEKLTSAIPILTEAELDESRRDQLRKVAASLSQPWIRCAVDTFSDNVKNDWKSCSKCAGVLNQVVTLSCGHSFCRKCVDGKCANQYCFKCGWRQLGSSVPIGANLKTNVTVSNLVEKWWSAELKAIEFRNQGNQLFSDGCFDDALNKYHEAANFCKLVKTTGRHCFTVIYLVFCFSFLTALSDFALFSNRSNIYSKMGKYEEALRDADTVIQLRPDWPKVITSWFQFFRPFCVKYLLTGPGLLPTGCCPELSWTSQRSSDSFTALLGF